MRTFQEWLTDVGVRILAPKVGAHLLVFIALVMGDAGLLDGQLVAAVTALVRG